MSARGHREWEDYWTRSRLACARQPGPGSSALWSPRSRVPWFAGFGSRSKVGGPRSTSSKEGRQQNSVLAFHDCIVFYCTLLGTIFTVGADGKQ